MEVFQNSLNILGIILHIWCKNSQKLDVLHWHVEILQWNTIGVPLIYACNHILRDNSESSLILMDTRYIQ